VFEGRDADTGRVFYRPLGGGIKFRETGAQALAREIREETKQEITAITFQGFIENLFTLDGEARHELVLVYSADFVSSDIQNTMEFEGAEDDGNPIRVRWMDTQYFMKNPGLLVPAELLGMLKQT